MKYHEAIELLEIELEKAKKKHIWTDKMDVVHRASFVAEESGELTQAANDHMYADGNHIEAMKLEAAQTAAVAIRFLMNVEKIGGMRDVGR